jgi:hypothetical protein
VTIQKKGKQKKKCFRDESAILNFELKPGENFLRRKYLKTLGKPERRFVKLSTDWKPEGLIKVFPTRDTLSQISLQRKLKNFLKFVEALEVLALRTAAKKCQ